MQEIYDRTVQMSLYQVFITGKSPFIFRQVFFFAVFLNKPVNLIRVFDQAQTFRVRQVEAIARIDNGSHNCWGVNFMFVVLWTRLYPLRPLQRAPRVVLPK